MFTRYRIVTLGSIDPIVEFDLRMPRKDDVSWRYDYKSLKEWIKNRKASGFSVVLEESALSDLEIEMTQRNRTRQEKLLP